VHHAYREQSFSPTSDSARTAVDEQTRDLLGVVMATASYPTSRLREHAARLAELLINLFLPLFCVLARQSGSVGFEAYLKNFYFWLPQVTSYQAVLRYFPWWKAYAERWPRQAVWQGFIQLYREFCELGNCAHCPLRHRPVDLQAEND